MRPCRGQRLVQDIDGGLPDLRQFAGKTLNVALAPGRIDDLNKIAVPGFEQMTGAKVQLTGARSADALARVRIEKDRPTLDVVWVDIGEALLLGNEGLIAKVSETDIPNIAVTHLSTPSPYTLRGIKGMGEGGSIAPGPAIASAVADALSPLGHVFVNELPLTPDRVQKFADQARDAGR